MNECVSFLFSLDAGHTRDMPMGLLAKKTFHKTQVSIIIIFISSSSNSSSTSRYSNIINNKNTDRYYLIRPWIVQEFWYLTKIPITVCPLKSDNDRRKHDIYTTKEIFIIEQCLHSLA